MADKAKQDQATGMAEAAGYADFAQPKTLKQSQVQRARELRAIAMHAMDNGVDDIPHWEYIGELKNLKIPKFMNGTKFEARIILLILAQVRHRQVIGTIRNLRAYREKRGQMDDFRAFEAYIKERTGGKAITYHSFDATTFEQIDHAPVWSTISEHMELLKSLGHDVFLNSGTLLGVVRDGKLIDHDDDVDLAIVLKARTMASAAREWLKLIKTLQDKGVVDDDAFDNPAVMKLNGIGDIKIDLFPAWFQKGDLFVYPHTSGQLQRADLLPLQTCKVTGNPIPAEPEKMLAQNYGKGWQDPDPYFKFPWAKAHEIFAEFLKAVKSK